MCNLNASVTAPPNGEVWLPDPLEMISFFHNQRKPFSGPFLFPLSDLFVAVKQFFMIISLDQHAKKVVSDSPGLVDFAIGQVKIVLK